MVGVFYLATSSAEILGLLPHSDETPPLAQRVARCLPLAAMGTTFVLPYRMVRSRRSRILAGGALLLSLAWFVYLSADGVRGWLTGGKSWHVIPVAAFFTAMVVANLWAFVRITDRVQPATV